MAWFDGELEITSGEIDAGEIGYQLMSDVDDLLREKQFVIGHLKFNGVIREKILKRYYFLEYPRNDSVGRYSVGRYSVE